MRRKFSSYYRVVLTILLLCLVTSSWAQWTGNIQARYNDAQAILPGSFWTPVTYVLIDDAAGEPDNEEPVYLISVTVAFGSGRAVPAGAPRLQPGDIAAIALARGR